MTKQRISVKQVQEELSGKIESVAESTNKALDAIEEKIESKFNAVLKAINTPTTIRKTFDADDQHLGEDYVAEAKEVDGESIIETPSQANPNSVEFKKKADNLAFMEQLVDIHIQESNERDADPVFEVSVNGIKQVFVRGQDYKVPRKFVEGLARAKPVHFSNQKYTKSDGEMGYRWPTRRGLRYGFSVLHDPDPRGKAWLSEVLAQP